MKRQVAVKSTRGFALKSTHGIAIKSTNMASVDKGESAPVRKNTRQFYDGEESCYIIDAKLEGNLGRYLNVRPLPRSACWPVPGPELLVLVTPFLVTQPCSRGRQRWLA